MPDPTPDSRETLDPALERAARAARKAFGLHAMPHVGQAVRDNWTNALPFDDWIVIARAVLAAGDTRPAPDEAAPYPGRFPRVAGRCPACGGASLFLAVGDHVTCSRLDCTAPCAVDDYLHAEAGQAEPPGERQELVVGPDGYREHRLAGVMRTVTAHRPEYGPGTFGGDIITACSCGERRPRDGYGGWWAWHVAEAIDGYMDTRPDLRAVPAPGSPEVVSDLDYRMQGGLLVNSPAPTGSPEQPQPPPPLDFPPFNMAITRSVGSLCRWEDHYWRWNGRSWDYGGVATPIRHEPAAQPPADPPQPTCDCHLHEHQVCDICQGELVLEDVEPPPEPPVSPRQACELCGMTGGRGLLTYGPGNEKRAACPVCWSAQPSHEVQAPTRPDGDVALELLRELVELHRKSVRPNAWAVSEYRHGARTNDWADDWTAAFTRAHALLYLPTDSKEDDR